MAIDKLPHRKNKKIIEVSLLVLRITKGSCNGDCFKIRMSKPCASCVYSIDKALSKGYRITEIYYSNELGEMIHIKLKDLLKEKNHICSYYLYRPIPKYLKDYI